MDVFTGNTASCSAQRLLQKTSGLFDRELTDVTTDSLTSVDNLDAMMTDGEDGALMLSQNDLYNIIHKEGEALLGNSAETSWLDQPGDLDFEEFTDLSDFLLGEEAMETAPDNDDVFETAPDNDEVFELVPVDKKVFELPSSVSTDGTTAVISKKGRKRKAAEVTEPTATPAFPADHSGYTAKNKRPRLSSLVSVTSTDTESEIVSTSTPRTREEKYVERRNKNNVASRRSRETRKQKFVNMEEKANELEESNAELRQRLVLLEEMAKEMKEILIQRMSQK